MVRINYISWRTTVALIRFHLAIYLHQLKNVTWYSHSHGCSYDRGEVIYSREAIVVLNSVGADVDIIKVRLL